MVRQTKFEQLWAERHGIAADTLIQYRFKDKDGYRLPGMAAHYRTFCDTLDSVVIDLSDLSNCFSPDNCGDLAMWHDDVRSLVVNAGLKVAP